MKVFQMRSSIVLILSFSLIGSGILVPNSSAQDTQIPNWVKNVAGWWGSGDISENEFVTGIEYLINNNIILLDFVPCNDEIQSQYGDTKSVPDWIKNNANWWSEAFFEIYGAYGNCIMDGDSKVWEYLLLALNPNKLGMYNEVAVWNDPQKTVVVYPYFTFIAYTEPGFYTYYRGECDDCTTTKFTQPTPLYTSSGIGHQALTLLGYTSITDMDIDKNPSILQQFDKVIMLHNEYVTRTMFDAITNHPNVLYLYPNALYAEIEVNYIDETITLIRGHNYPEPEITNGFDWEFDNTHPYEYDSECQSMDIYKIKNGWMTTCYPENIFLKESQQLFDLLKVIKDL